MYINKCEKIVIKIGSSILIDKRGKPKKRWLGEFVKDIKFLINKKNKLSLYLQGLLLWVVNTLELIKKV